MATHVHGVCPLDCPDTCSWVVTVEDGRAVKLLGNRENTEFSNLPALRDKAGPQRVLLHADDAAPRGLLDGDVARVWNDRGEYLALVQISDRVPPGILGGAKGHWPKLNPGGTSIAATVMEKDADMGRGAVFHDNRVEVERAPMRRADFLQAFATLGHGRA